MKQKSEKKEQKNNKMSRKKLAILASITTLILIIIISIIIVVVIYPKKCIENINTNYDSKQYDKVAQYESKLKVLKFYLKKDEKQYAEIQYKVKMSEAIKFSEKQKFEEALEELRKIENKDEIVKEMINDYKYKLVKRNIEEEQYDKALENLKEITNEEEKAKLTDEVYYNSAINFLENKDYRKAIEAIGNVKNTKYENLQETKNKIHYEYGIYSFNKKDYNGAISQLEMVGNYKDAKKYTENAYIAKAEELIEMNDLSGAKQIYDYISDKAEYNGVKASTRKKQLNNAKSMINATGKKYATKTYCESRNVWKYDGRWENWYIDKSDSLEYIDTTLEMNEDGTFNIEGTVYFYAFDNFSSLQKYCNAKIISRTIEMEKIKNIPSTYKIDKDTKLLYSNGKFSIKYSVKDDYSTSFYNVYSSSVTY